MNKKKIEKSIKENINVTPNFSSIKNKIDFDKHTKENEDVKVENKVKFKFNYWKFATPLAMIVVLLVLFVQKGNNPNLGNLSTSKDGVIVEKPGNVSSMISASESTGANSNEVTTNPNTSNIVSKPTNNDFEEDETKPSEPDAPEGSAPGEDTVEYSKQDGYFYFDESIYEGPESISELIYVRYYFDESKEYSQGEKIKVKAYIGASLGDSTSLSLMFKLNGVDVCMLDNVDNTYTYNKFLDELYKSYIHFDKGLEFEIELPTLEEKQGKLNLTVEAINNNVEIHDEKINYFIIENNNVVLY